MALESVAAEEVELVLAEKAKEEKSAATIAGLKALESAFSSSLETVSIVGRFD